MIQLNELLNLECTKVSVPCTSKKRALEMISEMAANYANINSEPLFDCLLEREKVGTTAVGNGVAMPHGKIQLEQFLQINTDELDGDNENKQAIEISPKAIAVLICCEEPVEFDAPDNRPVEVLFALFVPENQCDIHMQTLTYVAKVLGEPSTIKKLRYAESDQELYDIMLNAYTNMAQMDKEEISVETECE